MERGEDGRLWRQAGGRELLWDEICRVAMSNGAEQAIVKQLLGNSLLDNQASLSEAMALLHILSINPPPSSSPSSSASASSPSLSSTRLPSPVPSPSAFVRHHASKLNAYDIDDVLDDLRGAFAKENVYLNRCIDYLRKKLEEQTEFSYKKKSTRANEHLVKNMIGNNNIIKQNTSTMEKRQTFPNTLTMDKRPTVPNTITRDKRPTLPHKSTMDKRPTVLDKITMDKRPTLPNTSALDKKPILQNTNTTDKRTTLSNTSTMGMRSTFPKRLERNTELKDANGMVNNVHMRNDVLIGKLNVLEETRPNLERLQLHLRNDVLVRKSKVLNEKRPNLERLPSSHLSKHLSDQPKFSTLQNVRVDKTHSSHVMSTKGNIMSLVHTKKKCMP